MTYFRFSNMEVEEKVVLTFPFAAELTLAGGATLSGSPTVDVLNIGGVTDATPSSLVASSSVDGTDVLVAVDGRIKGADYELRVTCATSDPAHVLTRVGRIMTE